ncbi:MAG: nucleotidyltransferase [Actinobacteria bacterium]|nr:nucleotidyltransferase [Actinomycetota bacterium]
MTPVRRADVDPDRGPSDPMQVFTTLNGCRVDYVLIGGWAVIAHGSSRMTQDVDFVAGTDSFNLDRLARALAELGAELWGVDAHLLGIELNTETLANGANFTLTTEAGGVDFFNAVPGGAAYSEVRRRAVAALVRGQRVKVAGREDLIRMKRAAGRPRDLEDLAFLEEASARERRAP